MDNITDFVKNAISGSENGAVTEGIKALLGDNFDSLKGLLDNNDLEGFKNLLGKILSENSEIKEYIQKLGSGEDVLDSIKDKFLGKLNMGGIDLGKFF